MRRGPHNQSWAFHKLNDYVDGFQRKIRLYKGSFNLTKMRKSEKHDKFGKDDGIIEIIRQIISQLTLRYPN